MAEPRLGTVKRCAKDKLRSEQHGLGFLQAHQFMHMRRAKLFGAFGECIHGFTRLLQPVGLFEDTDVIGEHDLLQITQDAVGLRFRRGIEPARGVRVQLLHLRGIDAWRRRAVEIFDCAFPRDPAGSSPRTRG